jgi:general stress protein 26
MIVGGALVDDRKLCVGGQEYALVMRWSEIATCQRALGAVAHDALIKRGVLLVGTTRRDGSARISGAEPLVMDGQLWLSMMPTSTKAHDLRRDPRILLHSIVTNPAPAAEVMVRGTARIENDRDVQRRYAAAVATNLGWQPVVGEFTLIEVDIDDVTYIGHDHTSNAQHVARWPAGSEYVRPSITPTSLGPPQRVQRLLTTETTHQSKGAT